MTALASYQFDNTQPDEQDEQQNDQIQREGEEKDGQDIQDGEDKNREEFRSSSYQEVEIERMRLSQLRVSSQKGTPNHHHHQTSEVPQLETTGAMMAKDDSLDYLSTAESQIFASLEQKIEQALQLNSQPPVEQVREQFSQTQEEIEDYLEVPQETADKQGNDFSQEKAFEDQRQSLAQNQTKKLVQSKLNLISGSAKEQRKSCKAKKGKRVSSQIQSRLVLEPQTEDKDETEDRKQQNFKSDRVGDGCMQQMFQMFFGMLQNYQSQCNQQNSQLMPSSPYQSSSIVHPSSYLSASLQSINGRFQQHQPQIYSAPQILLSEEEKNNLLVAKFILFKLSTQPQFILDTLRYCNTMLESKLYQTQQIPFQNSNFHRPLEQDFPTLSMKVEEKNAQKYQEYPQIPVIKASYFQQQDKDRAQNLKRTSSQNQDQVQGENKKQAKDPAAVFVSQVKLPKNCFIYFKADKLPTVMAEQPHLSLNQATSELSRMWKLIPPEELQKYVSLAAADKQRYISQRDQELRLAQERGMTVEYALNRKRKRKAQDKQLKQDMKNINASVDQEAFANLLKKRLEDEAKNLWAKIKKEQPEERRQRSQEVISNQFQKLKIHSQSDPTSNVKQELIEMREDDEEYEDHEEDDLIKTHTQLMLLSQKDQPQTSDSKVGQNDQSSLNNDKQDHKPEHQNRPTTYLTYFSSRSAELRKDPQYRDLTNQELSKMICQEWKERSGGHLEQFKVRAQLQNELKQRQMSKAQEQAQQEQIQNFYRQQEQQERLMNNPEQIPLGVEQSKRNLSSTEAKQRQLTIMEVKEMKRRQLEEQERQKKLQNVTSVEQFFGF